MYERFNQEARRATFFADREARQAGSSYVEPEHLFLGLIHQTDSKANKLFALASRAEDFRKQLNIHAFDKTSKSQDYPVSNTCRRVLIYALEEADQLKSVTIGTEHLLLGLLRESKSKVPAALATVGIDLDSARKLIRRDAGFPALEDQSQSEP
jgi:ATP-dependent Clp protease ATP-binding subunit ClpC